MIDTAAKKVLIGLLTSLRTFRSFAVKHQLHGIQNGRLAAAVHPTKQHHWLRLPTMRRRCKIELVLTFVDAKVAEFQFVNDHVLLPISSRRMGIPARLFCSIVRKSSATWFTQVETGFCTTPLPVLARPA